MPTRPLIALLLPCALVLLSGCHQPGIHRQASQNNRSITVGDPATLAADDAASARARQLLDKRLTMTFEANKLVNVLDAIEREVDLPIHINWTALEASGVEKDVAISTRVVRDITVRQALELIIDMAAAGAELEPLGYEIRGGIVHVTTIRELQKNTFIRIYNIRDLIEPIPTVPRKLGFDESDMTIRLSFPGSGGSMTLFAREEPEPRQNRHELIEQITVLIQDQVGRQSDWHAYGGEVGSLREFEGDLIIKTTTASHQQIEHLLTALRASRAKARHEFEEQWKKIQTAGVPDLLTELRRMEAKFDKFNEEYFTELAEQRNKATQE